MGLFLFPRLARASFSAGLCAAPSNAHPFEGSRRSAIRLRESDVAASAELLACGFAAMATARGRPFQGRWGSIKQPLALGRERTIPGEGEGAGEGERCCAREAMVFGAG